MGMKKKKIQLPLWMKNVLETVAECDPKAKKDPKEKRKLIQLMAIEAYTHSLTPGEKIGQNPSALALPQSLPPWFFSQIGSPEEASLEKIRSKSLLPASESVRIQKRIEGAIESLTAQYMLTQHGYRTPKSAREATLWEYQRLLIATLITSVLEIPFSIGSADILSAFERYSLKRKPLHHLNMKIMKLKFIQALSSTFEEWISPARWQKRIRSKI